ncbi:rifin [Plasmodium sp. gorilla clade G1]|nr:rifin [Plasmodium sp. gorilla clade G1]
MKVLYSKILLFSLPFNILVLSSYVHNKNKPYMTPHTPTTTSRMLSECDMNTSIYSNDPDMKSVKESFDRQTSQRFEKFNKRMITRRKKYKDQRDKDIQQIILKDKIDKSLAEKMEKVCLKCGCGLGGVAASVGIIGPIAVNEWAKAAFLAAKHASMVDAAAEGASQGAAAGAAKVVESVIKDMSIQNVAVIETLKNFINANNYNQTSLISQFVNMQYNMTCKTPVHAGFYNPSDSMCDIITTLGHFEGSGHMNVSAETSINIAIEKIVADAKGVSIAKTGEVTIAQRAILETRYVDAVDATYASCQTAIIASVVAILVIVLVMAIIFLILRYRRKKKMSKKQQYTKLLNQ